MRTTVMPKETVPAAAAEERQPAGLRVLHTLIEKFERGEFQSGQPIKESVLAKNGDWSRNAVREALNQLVGWDILEYTPYCGYRVRAFTLQDLLEWYELREAIEPIAARRVARLRPRSVLDYLKRQLEVMEAFDSHHDLKKYSKADLDFHLHIVANCGNRQFAQKQMQAKVIALFFVNSYADFKYFIHSDTLEQFDHRPSHEEFDSLNRKLTIDTHAQILEALCRGDAEKAERACREHLASLVRDLENFILYYPGLDKGDPSILKQSVSF